MVNPVTRVMRCISRGPATTSVPEAATVRRGGLFLAD